MKARVSEKTEQAHIVQLLRSIGADVWILGTRRAKGDYQGTRQTPGLPDVLACLPWKGNISGGFRRMVAIECKSATGRLRPAQEYFAACCQESDMLHVVGGLDAVIAKLVELGYLKAENVAHYRRPEAVLQ